MQLHIFTHEPTEGASSTVGGTDWNLLQAPIDDRFDNAENDNHIYGEDDLYQYETKLPDDLVPAAPERLTDVEREAITAWVHEHYSDPQGDTPTLPTRSRMMGGEYWIVTTDGDEQYHRTRRNAERAYSGATMRCDDVQLSIEHTPSPGDRDAGEVATHLVRDHRDPLRTLHITDSTLRLIKAALRNLHIDLQEAPDFYPWNDQDGDPEEDRLTTRIGMETALADAVDAIHTVVNVPPGAEPVNAALHVTQDRLERIQDALDDAAAAAGTEGEAAALRSALDLATDTIGIGRRPAGGNQHLISSVVTLDSGDQSRIDAFRGQAMSYLAAMLTDEFQGDDLAGYEGARVIGTPTFHLGEQPTVDAAPARRAAPQFDPDATVRLVLSTEVETLAVSFNPTEATSPGVGVGGDLATSGGNFFITVDDRYLGSLFVAPDERTGLLSVMLGTSIGSDENWTERDAIPLEWVQRED